MTDPPSLAASVTGLLSVGLHVSHIIAQIINDTRSAPKAIRSLSLELIGLCKILGSLEALLQGNPLQSATFPAEELSELLENVMGDFIGLQTIVGVYTAGPTGSTFRQRWKQFLLAFREADVLDLKKNIEAYKASLNLTLTIAELSGVFQVVRTNEELRECMGVLTTELAEVRALCQQLKDRRGASSTSLQRISSNSSSSSTTPLSLVVTNKSRASGNSVSSSYRAASIIECYCSRIEFVHDLCTQRQDLMGSNSPPYGLPVSRAIATNLTLRISKYFSSVLGGWSFPFPQSTYAPVIIPTSDATDNRYRFSGMLFYPAPELVPEVFARKPPRYATVDEKDEYIRHCVEANAVYVFNAARKECVYGMDLKRSLGLMKMFWRRYAMYRVDPQIDGPFTSPSIPAPPVLLRMYGFILPNVSVRPAFMIFNKPRLAETEDAVV